jgi:L-amino acid N-acyltransferase YncA
MSEIGIRPATVADVGAVAAIYNQGIDDRLATFETRLRAPEEVAAWLDDGLPFLVATNGDAVVGSSRIFTDNPASRSAHLAAGFEEVGIQRRHGRLDGRWKDCVLVERLLGEAAES